VHTYTRTYIQRIKEELAAEEERKFRENAAAEAEIRWINVIFYLPFIFMLLVNLSGLFFIALHYLIISNFNFLYTKAYSKRRRSNQC
jgi:hypothetical protein